ncbi:hypothetical protein, partial [Haloferax sp. Atlit-10N]|uniref:hypothetical protein n=1 Tax=Haloferax sp. Atlit-10N TaxID=2077204 RepID=UPI0011C4113C
MTLNQYEYYKKINMSSNKIVKKLQSEYSDAYSAKQYEAVARVIKNKEELGAVQFEDIELESGPEAAVIVRIGNQTYCADPEGEYCVKHGKKGSQQPPEGKIEDGKGNNTFGI